MQSLGDYHDVYMETDVYLLADIFQNFRKTCHQSYKLDPAHYYTSPGLAWDACLRMTRVELDLITDIDMHLFVEKGTRGGISMITTRYAKANNPYLPKYDSSQDTSYISYLDMNNLYGCAMIASLPTGGFKWIDPSSVNIDQVPADQGYFLEVDLEYPDELHYLHSDYPLAPETMKIDETMLSAYSSSLLQELQLNHSSSAQKLVPNLNDKTQYVLHHRNLQFYLAHGLKLKKVHRVLQFQQRPWLKAYIDFNTEKRKVAANEFEKDFFKLMNNAVYGKTMENQRKHSHIELVHLEKRLRKQVAKPSFHRMRLFNKDLVGVELKKTLLTLSKPIYVGCAILEISKILMYQFHYDHILPKYGVKAKLLFTDTDSLCYHIKTSDVYQDMKEDGRLYDLSEYPETHFLHSKTNKKVLGKMKDEVSSGVASSFVGLRPKCYSLKTTTGEKNTAKGVSRITTKRDLRHKAYKRCLFKKKNIIAKMFKITNRDHQLYTVRMEKLSLSATDDKRYVLCDGINTLAHGHFAIGLVESDEPMEFV